MMSGTATIRRSALAVPLAGLLALTGAAAAVGQDIWSPQGSIGVHAGLSAEVSGVMKVRTGGVWRPGLGYAAGSVVRFDGAAWIARSDNTGERPGANSAVWKVLVKDGTNGTNGSDGAAGKNGVNGATGAEGPVGPTGARGDVGPTGPQGSQGPPGGATTQPLLGPSNKTIGASAPVLFDTVVYSGGNISYNAATGVVTFHDAGTYTVQFGMFVDGLLGTVTPPNYVGFQLSSSQGDACTAQSALTSGTVGRTCIIGVSVAPVTMSLSSASSATVNLVNLGSPKGWLIVSNEDSPRVGLQLEVL